MDGTQASSNDVEQVVVYLRISEVTISRKTSRTGDPHRHIHFQIGTRVWAGGKWRALTTAALFKQQGAIRALGTAVIAAHPQLAQTLAEHELTLDPVSGEVIMTAVSRDDTAEALALIDASHHILHEQRQTLARTTKILNAISNAVDEPLHPRMPMSIGELAHLLGVRTSTLRVWENAGLLTPARVPGGQHRSYDANDVRDARVTRLLRQGHNRLTRIKPVTEELRCARTGTALRSALEERHTTFTARARAMLHGAALINQHLTEHTDSENHPAP